MILEPALASSTATSGKPTILKRGSPPGRLISASIGYASIPKRAME